MFFISLGLHLTDYALVISPIALIVLSHLPKIVSVQDWSSGWMISIEC